MNSATRMRMCQRRLRLVVRFAAPLLLVAACGGKESADPSAEDLDGGADTSASVPSEAGADLDADAPIACTLSSLQREGAACSTAGMVCEGESRCQMCGYMSWQYAPTRCTCTAAGKWSCAPKYVVDCGPYAPGAYSDATCTTPRDPGTKDGGSDADAAVRDSGSCEGWDASWDSGRDALAGSTPCRSACDCPGGYHCCAAAFGPVCAPAAMCP